MGVHPAELFLANKIFICAGVYEEMQLSPVIDSILQVWDAREALAIKFETPWLTCNFTIESLLLNSFGRCSVPSGLRIFSRYTEGKPCQSFLSSPPAGNSGVGPIWLILFAFWIPLLLLVGKSTLLRAELLWGHADWNEHGNQRGSTIALISAGESRLMILRL